MTRASNIFGAGNDIPLGDALRRASVSVNNTGGSTEHTLVTITSTPGTFHGLYVKPYHSTTSTTTLTDIKVTVDGASERTLSLGAPLSWSSGFTGSSFIQIPVPIKFSDSLTVKVVANKSGTSIQSVTVQGLYSEVV